MTSSEHDDTIGIRAEEFLQRYFDGTITDLESEELIEIWKRHPQIAAEALRNYKINHLLGFRARLRRDRQLLFARLPHPPIAASSRSETEEDGSTIQIALERIDLDAAARLVAKESRPSFVGTEYEGDRKRFELSSKTFRRIEAIFAYSERWFRRLLVLFLLSLSVGIILILVRSTFSGRSEKLGSDKTVAHIIKSERAIWDDPLKVPESGGPIRKGTLKLLEGLVSIRLIDGAEIALEGPAELDFESASKLKLLTGYLSADVPPQPRELVIGTPQMDIKVLGTSFWIHADRDKTDVHLVRGKLEIASPQIGTFQLLGNEAFSLPSVGDSKRFAAMLDAFIPPSVPSGFSDRRAAKRYDHWKQSSSSLDGSKDLLIRFDFEKVNDKRIPNLAEAGKDVVADAILIGGAACEGRWPGKKGLKFDGTTGGVAFTLPDRFKQLSILVSLRIDSLSKLYNGVLMSDLAGSESGHGRLQWQLTDRGVLRLGMIPQNSDKPLVSLESPPIVRPGRPGGWMQLAVVFDSVTGTVTQYVNAKKVATGELPDAFVPEIGPARIGGWLKESGEKIERGLDGAVDELLIFNRALAPEEIKRIMLQYEL